MTRHDRDSLVIASRLAGHIPGLLLEAEKIAHTVMRGVHGRRRTGQGETFWQFRPYQSGDSARDIDWRQTARRGEAFVRQLEWEASQTLWLWRDASASMSFRSSQRLLEKRHYAEILLLALGMMALRGGEQVGLLATDMPPQTGDAGIQRIFRTLPQQSGYAGAGRPVAAHSAMVLVSDFYAPIDDLAAFCAAQAARGVTGVLVQATDPAEETLPYTGRTRFEDMTGAEDMTIPQVEAIRDAYIAKFKAHRAALQAAADACGWHFLVARTDTRAEEILAQLYGLLAARKAG